MKAVDATKESAETAPPETTASPRIKDSDAHLTARDEATAVELAVEQARSQAEEAMRKVAASKASVETQAQDDSETEQLTQMAELAKQRAEALAKAALLEEQRQKAASGGQAPPLPSGTMTALPPQLQEPIRKAQALNAELHQAKAHLQDLHQKALKAPEVLTSQGKLEDAALLAIEKISPGITPEWHRMKALINEMEDLRKSARSGQIPPGVQGNMMEMEQLSAKIRPLQMQVSELPEIQRLKAEFAAAVDAELFRLDPKAAELKARHEAILRELGELREELSKLQGRIAPQAPAVTAPGN